MHPNNIDHATFKKTSVLNWTLFILAFTAACAVPCYAALLKGVPIEIKQPDGTIIHAYATGDEYRNYVHDEDGYVAMQDSKTKYWFYAQEVNGQVQPTTHILGRVKPKLLGLSKGVEMLQSRTAKGSLLRSPQDSTTYNPENSTAIYSSGSIAFSSGSGTSGTSNLNYDFNSGTISAPTTGNFNNIAIFVRFSDDIEFTASTATFSALFNASTSGAVSMYNYFKEASYNQLLVTTSFYPSASGTVLSYHDSHPRAYYQSYDATANPIGYRTGQDYVTREQTLLNNAVQYIAYQVPQSINVDINSDGYIDNVCLILRGLPDGWASLLWPHKSIAGNLAATIHGKKIGTYNVQIEGVTLPNNVGVLCHEFFHSLGAPDLYRYSQDVGDWFDAVGPWDLMATVPNTPTHMSAYLKYRYGHWLSLPPLISQSGTYTLNPLPTATGNAYRIASPYSTTEYFMVEYRKKTGTFEQSLPGEGLLVYRINTAAGSLGNASGPPDEAYIYRPSGTLFTNGSIISAAYSSTSANTSLSDTTSPSSFLSGGGSGGLQISSVGAPGAHISFGVTIPSSVVRISAPATPTGASQGASSTPYQYATSLAAVQGKTLQYRFYFDDGDFSNWSASASTNYTFFGSRTYKVRAQASYAGSPGVYSDWSAPFLVDMDFTTPSPYFEKQRVPAPTDARMMIYSMAMGDVDGDGQQELIVMYAYLPSNYAKDRVQDLVVYGWQNGKLTIKGERYGTSVQYPEGWQVFVADVDGDGRAEILKGSEMIHFSAGNFTSTPMPVYVPLAVGDVKNDGNIEVVSYDGSLYRYNGGWISAGNIVIPSYASYVSKIAIGDVDGDGLNEVVVAAGNGTNTGSVTVFRAAGNSFTTLWSKTQWLNMFTDLKIGDWDLDGTNEIILANDQDSSIHVFKYSGAAYSEVWSQVFNGYSGMGWVPSVALGKFNPSSAGNDLLVGLGGHCAQPTVGSGVYLVNVGVLFHDASTSYGVGSLLLADLDGDGWQDLIAGSTDGNIYIYSVPKSQIPVTITTGILPNSAKSAAYSQTLTAAGATSPYTWSLASGSLPPGLLLNASTGVLSGTPTTTGTYSFTVKCTSANKTSTNKLFSIKIGTPPAVVQKSLPDGTNGNAYSQTLTATGGTSPYTWLIAGGSLPTGLTLTASSGAIQGTPTVAGSYSFTVRCKGADYFHSDQTLSITIYSSPAISVTSLPSGVKGTSYSQTITATGGKTPYTWSVLSGALPAGLSLNASTGVISGTPTTGNSYTFTLRCTDANKIVSNKSFTVVITQPTIIQTSIPNGKVGTTYSQTMTAIGGRAPYAWSVLSGALPAGLSLNASTGVISGTPTTANSYTFTLRCTDANKTVADKAFTVVISTQPTINQTSMPNGKVGTTYSQTLTAANGKTPYTWSIMSGALPLGLSLNASTGVISGKPTKAGTYSFTLRCTDGNKLYADKAFIIIIGT